MAHNPEVEGSNPSPATKARGPFSNRERAFCLWFVRGFVHGACSSRACLLYGRERPADYQLGERFGDMPVGFQVGLDILLHGERHIRVADAMAQRLPVDLGIASRGGVAVPYVVQVDLGQSRGRGELLEPSRDRVRMWRPSVWPAEQHAVIVVVRAEV